MKTALLASCSLLLALTPVSSRAEDFTKEEIQKIVRDYLIEHPEVMMDAMVAMKEYKVQQSLKQNEALIETYKKELFSDPATPSIGPKDAEVTLVEFYDYNCGACKILYAALIDYLKEDKKLRVVFKEYPIFGENSQYPARLALAVHRLEPEKYFDFHKELMGHQGRVTPEVAEAAMDKLGLDKDKIEKEASSKAVILQLEADRKLAAALGAGGTPLVVLNNEIIPHAMDLEMLREKVAAHQKSD